MWFPEGKDDPEIALRVNLGGLVKRDYWDRTLHW